MNDARQQGEWVTNVVLSLDTHWPRRDARLREGPPMATADYTREELASRNIRGAYLDEEVPEGIKSRPIILRPKSPVLGSADTTIKVDLQKEKA